jgi:hypothetical protein
MGRYTNSHMEGSMGIASHRTCRHARLRAASGALAAAAIAAGAALVPGSAGARSADAHAARSLSVKESAKLHLANHHGVELKEQGTAKGTLTGPLYLQLRVTSTRSVSAKVQVYPSGGRLNGSASGNYHVVGSFASFSGRMNITGGEGRFAKAHGSGLSFSGTIQRSNDAVTVYVSGKFSY